ncbi:TPA: phage head morphogenesis protein [Staphylococcus pseudintermedius]|uniref:polymorphic toxin type 50 domain-containing protein n=2 Tax=Staphylococcus pseudintermedius TaxID=283734 RepID=UPI00111CFC78|nr:polymorphic toxin type 50 domain-containing protein [Staphylococcus pseudintermedius]EGQ3700671.1 phage head morphogenesis protein [Staphylococcus pseudintermedius]EIE3599606.1 minor capsid protein [Staphylococcus pseudintermedius]EJA1915233.1 minor capsid protein [Staphylococcus pseudintermedius]TPC13010.1 phage head morphogenesis protein [Staphylococcus pseudintermedius]HAR6033875.1 phage head morphogenesis protein [Staphylococcus pseudintermedius]
MSNLSDYWLERAKMFIQSETLEDAAKVAEIERIVAMMIADIYKNLLAYYGKLATAEGIDWREAKKIVDAFDVEMFQMQAKAYVENKDFSEKASQELKRFNTTMYVNREQLLKHELGLIVTKAYAEQEKVVNHHLQDSVTRTLKHQAGILGADVYVKPTDIEAIVYSNFGKLNWSERLWNNQDELRKDVERMASHVMLRGRHPYEFVPEIRKKQQQTVANTKRLLITEAARVQTEAQKMHYLETIGDDAEYEFVAKRDEKTSKICRHYDKKVFKVKDMVPGVNAPPMHPHCRSTTVPHVGDWRDKFFKDRQGKYSVEYDKVLQKSAKDEMTDAIDSGKIKVELNVEKQNRHQLGHQLYEDYKKKNLQKGLPIPSYTILDNDELNALLIQKAGKGHLSTDNNGNWDNKEIINFDKIIGKAYIDGKFIATKWGKVHYSKTGTHIIPFEKRDKR